MLKYLFSKKWIIVANILSFALLLTIGIIFTSFVLDDIDKTQNTIVQNEFNRIFDNTLKDIQSNLTNIHDQLNLVAVSFDQYFNSNNTNLPYIEREVIRTVINNSAFEIFGIVGSIYVNDTFNRDRILNRSKQIYNRNSMIIYGLSPNGSFYEVSNNKFPLQLMVITAQEKAPIGIPVIGILDSYSITSTEEINGLLSLTYDKYSLSRVLYINRPDGTILTTITMSIHYLDWIISMNFNPEIFLSKIINDAYISQVNVEISDSIVGKFYNNKIIKKGVLSKDRLLSFTIINWLITISSTKLFDDSHDSNTRQTIIILFCVMYLVIFLFIIVSNYVIIYASRQEILKKELRNSRKIQLTKNAVLYILHEIRNILSIPFGYLDLMILNNMFDIDMLNSCKIHTNIAIEMSSKVLDLEQLLIKRYVPNIKNCDIITKICAIVSSGPSDTIVMYNINKINVDINKYIEIFNNGFVNACKFTNEKNIIVKVYKIDGYLVTEILNYCPKFNISSRNIEKMFIPFFMLDDNNYWDADSLINFSIDMTVYQFAKQYFTNIQMKKTVKLTGNNEQTFKLSKSNGLGLGLSRLIAKNFGGDVGLEKTIDNYVRFWFVIKEDGGQYIDNIINETIV